MVDSVVMLDREPLGELEQQLVNGFPAIETLEEIWVRERHTALTGGYPKLKIYLAFGVIDARGRELTERIANEFQHRNYWQKIDFDFEVIPVGTIPKDLPSRIWKRKSIVVVRK